MIVATGLPSWMVPSQVAAVLRGMAQADDECARPSEATPLRIAHADIVTFRPPAFLTDDYDPTHRPRTRR